MAAARMALPTAGSAGEPGPSRPSADLLTESVENYVRPSVGIDDVRRPWTIVPELASPERVSPPRASLQQVSSERVSLDVASELISPERDAPRPLPAAGPGRISVSLIANLVQAGLAVPVEGHAPPPVPRLTGSRTPDRDEPLVVRTRPPGRTASGSTDAAAEKPRRDKRLVVAIIVGLVLALAVVTLLLALR